MAHRSLVVAVIAAAVMCPTRISFAERAEAGPPEEFKRLAGLEACAFTGPETPGGPALIISRFNAASFSHELLLIPLDGSEPMLVGYGRDVDARGSQIAWVGTEPGGEGIWMRDLATDDPPRRLSDSLQLLNPSISPDGQRVACTQRTPQRDGIFVVERGARRPRVFTNRDEREPAWGPREDLMLAIKSDQLWLLIAARWEEMEQKRLTDAAMVHFDPAWGPDGRWVTYAAGFTRPQAQIALMHLETRQITWAAPGLRGARSPAISPDGDKLAFIVGEGEESVLYVCDLRLP